MAATTAGLLMCKKTVGLEYFLIHPGGPYWAGKDLGAWSIPKGLVEPGEDLLQAAQREFHEETGMQARGPFTPLGWLKTRGGKILHAWAFWGAWDPTTGIVSNQIQIEFPYRSRRFISIPEADRGAWWAEEDALLRINPSQAPMLERAKDLLLAAQRESS